VNQLAVEVLARSVGQPVQRRNLRGIPGRWTKKDAADFDGFMSETAASTTSSGNETPARH
jgi:hypothetical protein